MENTKRKSPKKVATKKATSVKVARKKRATPKKNTPSPTASQNQAPAKRKPTKKAVGKKKSPSTDQKVSPEKKTATKKAVAKKSTKKKTVAKKKTPSPSPKNTLSDKPKKRDDNPSPKKGSKKTNPPEKAKPLPTPPKRLLTLSQKNSDVYLPQRVPLTLALKRTTHLAIFAHQDDQELGAFHAINKCYEHPKKWFTGIVVTDGGGSNPSEKYPNASVEEICRIRKNEQRRASQIGRYSAQIQLAHHSSHLKNNVQETIIQELVDILALTKPEHIYTHSPFDKHPSHRKTFICLLEAIRRTKDLSPKNIYGCEIWGSLEWLPEDYRKEFSISEHPELLEDLLACFPSQIQGSRPYDLATFGRHIANATFSDPFSLPKNLATSYALRATDFCLSKKKLTSWFSEIQKAQKKEILALWEDDNDL